MLFVLIPMAWLLIMALFVAVCVIAARGDAVLALQFEGHDAVSVRRRRVRLGRASLRSRRSDRRVPVARSGAG